MSCQLAAAVKRTFRTKVDVLMNAGEPVGVIGSSERTVIDQVIERLAEKYPGVSGERVADVVNGCHSRFDGRPIRDYVPLFVERVARAQLAELSRTS